MKLKANDTIIILTGDDAGRRGTIAKVFPDKNKVLVPDINTYKKHLKSQGNQQGGVFTLPRPLSASKVMLICPHCQKPTRVGFVGQGNDKTRICKKCQKPITNEAKPKKK